MHHNRFAVDADTLLPERDRCAQPDPNGQSDERYHRAKRDQRDKRERGVGVKAEGEIFLRASLRESVGGANAFFDGVCIKGEQPKPLGNRLKRNAAFCARTFKRFPRGLLLEGVEVGDEHALQRHAMGCKFRDDSLETIHAAEDQVPVDGPAVKPRIIIEKPHDVRTNIVQRLEKTNEQRAVGPTPIIRIDTRGTR